MSGADDAQPHDPLAKSQARLAAVQALYQMDMAGTDLAEVIDEFKTHRIGELAEDRAIAGADAEHFARILHGVVRRQKELDPVVDGQLATPSCAPAPSNCCRRPTYRCAS
jgi:N utilization substance protein B